MRNWTITTKLLLCFSLTAVWPSLATTALASERNQVLWGGVGLSSPFDNPLAPVANKLMHCESTDESGRCPIDSYALNVMLDADFEKIELQVAYAEDRINYLLSPVIDAEWVSHVKLAESSEPYVYQFLILGAVLIYEVSAEGSQLLSSVPVSVYATRYFSKPLSLSQRNDIFEQMYLGVDSFNGQEGYYNIFNNLADQAAIHSDAPLKFPGLVKFTGVGYSDDVANTLSNDFDLSAITPVLASWATSNLASATGEMIIPFTLGQNDLRLVFRNAETRLTLPEPIYEFDMYVQAVETYKNSNYTCFDVAAYYGVKTFDDLLLDAPIQHGQDSCAFLQNGTARPNQIYVANLLSQIQKVMFSFSRDATDLNKLQSNIVSEKSMITSTIKKLKQDIFYEN